MLVDLVVDRPVHPVLGRRVVDRGDPDDEGVVPVVLVEGDRVRGRVEARSLRRVVGGERDLREVADRGLTVTVSFGFGARVSFTEYVSVTRPSTTLVPVPVCSIDTSGLSSSITLTSTLRMLTRSNAALVLCIEWLMTTVRSPSSTLSLTARMKIVCVRAHAFAPADAVSKVRTSASCQVMPSVETSTEPAPWSSSLDGDSAAETVM